MRSTSRSLFTSCLVLAAACRGGGSGDDQPDAGPNPNDTSIYDIQNPDNRVPLAADVNVRGVVVSAIDRYGERADGTRVGTIWIQEPAGGAFSGVLVFGAPLDQVAPLQIGDLVDVTGAAKSEFALAADTSGRTTTELEPGSAGAITVTVTAAGGTAPAPALVDALAIAAMDQAGKDVEWEKWEGVLIEVRDVAQISNISTISGEANFQRFQVSGGLELDTGLAPFPMNAVRDTCYASLVGIGDYFFQHKLLPRETAAIMAGGTGCPPPEEGAALCGDGLDNDFDGFADCADFSCQATAPACVTTTSIAEIQMGNVGGTVMLDNVVITSRSKDGKSLWVADALAAAPYNGVFVFRGTSAATPILGPEFAVGATVIVMGNVQEFDVNPMAGDTLTEINVTNGSLTFVAAPIGAPTPLTAASTMTLGSLVDGEPYEGVLVQLSNVKVTSDLGNGKAALIDNNGETVVMDDDIFDYDGDGSMMPPNGTCYVTLTAIGSMQLIDNIRTIAPRSALDMVVGVGCN